VSLTPKRNPLPSLGKKGVTETVASPASITVKNGLVTAVESGAPAASTSTGQIEANAPLNLSGGTLTIPAATDGQDGYLTAADHQTYSNLSAYGLLANRPVTPSTATGVAATYFATDVPAFYVWNGVAWVNICLCAPSSSSSSSSSSM